MKNQNEVNVLDELNKGACMGMDAIHFIMDKVEDDKLKEYLGEAEKESMKRDLAVTKAVDLIMENVKERAKAKTKKEKEAEAAESAE